MKRTLRTLDNELSDKAYLVGNKVILADLAFVPWDLFLEVVLEGDEEAASANDRKQLFPNWYVLYGLEFWPETQILPRSPQ